MKDKSGKPYDMNGLRTELRKNFDRIKYTGISEQQKEMAVENGIREFKKICAKSKRDFIDLEY